MNAITMTVNIEICSKICVFFYYIYFFSIYTTAESPNSLVVFYYVSVVRVVIRFKLNAIPQPALIVVVV